MLKVVEIFIGKHFLSTQLGLEMCIKSNMKEMIMFLFMP